MPQPRHHNASNFQQPNGAAVGISELLCRMMSKECDGILEADDFMRLDADEIQILYYRFVEGRTLKETGRLVRNKVNDKPADSERTRQRQNKALRKLRRYAA